MKATIFLISLIILFSCSKKKRALSEWPNGEKQSEIILHKGTIDNPIEYTFIYYYSNGDTFKIGDVKNGKESGTWTYYFLDNILKSKIDYKDGIMSGKFEQYYRNGNIKQEGHNRNNKLIDRINYDIYGNSLADSIVNIVQPSLNIKAWNEYQINTMKIECETTHSIHYENVELFCNCMIENISRQCEYEFYSNLTQMETDGLYQVLMRDGYCNGIIKVKNRSQNIINARQ